MPFAVEVVSPEQALLDGEAVAIVLRTSDGELTILDGHTPLVTDVVPGEVRVDREDGTAVRLAVHSGFLLVDNGTSATAPPVDPAAGGPTTTVTLLAGVAELAEDIDVPRAERSRDASQARVDELRSALGRSAGTPAPVAAEGETIEATPEEVELAEAEAALVRAEVRLRVAGATVS
jgi:F-type H+-transporting ATPase subunit epsilon